mgnify:CR=1 FL=1
MITFDSIGYSIPYDEKKYYQSMLLRSDDIIPKVEKSLWDKTSLCLDDQCVEARKEQDVEKLCTIYLSNKDIWNEGNVVDMFIYHKDISSIVEQIQNYMIAIIVKKKIAIESNPSSNVKCPRIIHFKPSDSICHRDVCNRMSSGEHVFNLSARIHIPLGSIMLHHQFSFFIGYAFSLSDFLHDRKRFDGRHAF